MGLVTPLLWKLGQAFTLFFPMPHTRDISIFFKGDVKQKEFSLSLAAVAWNASSSHPGISYGCHLGENETLSDV